MSRRKLLVALVTTIALIAGIWVTVEATLSDAFAQKANSGPRRSDGQCPSFRAHYARCEVRFGNRGLSTLNSFYETFVGQGAFEIRGFEVEALGPGRFDIVAASNRGPITSEIHADRVERLGEERENEQVNRTQQSGYCDQGRIYEHQVGYAGSSSYVQDLEFWTEGNALRFRLFQDGSATADVVCHPD